MRQEYPTARDVARKELREVLASTEALLEALGDEGGEAVDELRVRLTTTIAEVKDELGNSFMESARNTIYKARDTASAIDDFVQASPWRALAIGVGIGWLFGRVLRS